MDAPLEKINKRIYIYIYTELREFEELSFYDVFVDDRTKDSSSSSSSSWGQVSFIRRRLFCARRGERKRERHTRILWIGDGQRGADERSRVESRPGEIETAQTGGTEATVNGNYSGWSLNETCFFQILLACSLARSLLAPCPSVVRLLLGRACTGCCPFEPVDWDLLNRAPALPDIIRFIAS